MTQDTHSAFGLLQEKNLRGVVDAGRVFAATGVLEPGLQSGLEHLRGVVKHVRFVYHEWTSLVERS